MTGNLENMVNDLRKELDKAVEVIRAQAQRIEQLEQLAENRKRMVADMRQAMAKQSND